MTTEQNPPTPLETLETATTHKLESPDYDDKTRQEYTQAYNNFVYQEKGGVAPADQTVTPPSMTEARRLPHSVEKAIPQELPEIAADLTSWVLPHYSTLDDRWKAQMNNLLNRIAIPNDFSSYPMEYFPEEEDRDTACYGSRNNEDMQIRRTNEEHQTKIKIWYRNREVGFWFTLVAKPLTPTNNKRKWHLVNEPGDELHDYWKKDPQNTAHALRNIVSLCIQLQNVMTDNLQVFVDRGLKKIS